MFVSLLTTWLEWKHRLGKQNWKKIWFNIVCILNKRRGRQSDLFNQKTEERKAVYIVYGVLSYKSHLLKDDKCTATVSTVESGMKFWINYYPTKVQIIFTIQILCLRWIWSNSAVTERAKIKKQTASHPTANLHATVPSRSRILTWCNS